MALDDVADSPVEEALSHLRDHGWDVEVESGDGYMWATLISLENREFTVGRYGRGDDPESAITRAWQRFKTEQIGGLPED